MDSSRLVELGLVKVCRACLSDEGDMKSVFEEENGEQELWHKMQCISSLEVNQSDGLPDMICASCEQKLNTAYDFRIQCQRSHDTLRKYIDNALECDRYSVEEILVNVPCETVTQLKDEISIEEHVLEPCDMKEENGGDEMQHNSDSEDVDNKPLESRMIQPEKYLRLHLDSSLVNEAIVASKKRNNTQKDCHVCGFVSSNARGLSLHIAHLHKELKDRWCNTCHKEVDDLPAHHDIHVSGKTYICVFCKKGFSSQGHLTEHIRSHSSDRPHKCEHCSKGFLSARRLRVHERVHTGEKPYQCPHCDRRFNQNGSLQGHIRTHTGLKPYQCEECGKKLTTSSALSSHRINHGHGKKQPKKKDPKAPKTTTPPAPSTKLCTVCGKTFSSASKMRLHMRIHTGEQPYGCSHCTKRFSTRGQLVVHERVHTGERPHVCGVCGKGFAQSSVLNTHMKLHTGRPEQCRVCERRFCRPAELRLHMRRHTGEKPYVCVHCNQGFIQRSHLVEHIKIHSDERPYKCNLCERAFKQSSSLKSHVQIHTGHKPYRCSQCPYACRQSYALTQHMRQHQADQPLPEKPHGCSLCHRSFSTLAMLGSHRQQHHPENVYLLP